MFFSYFGVAYIETMLEPPDRIPAARFSVLQSGDERWAFYGCRHGLALVINQTRLQAVVWDPLTGHQRRVAFPSGFDDNQEKIVRNAGVICSGNTDHVHGDCHSSPFKLVLVRMDEDYTRALACLYESESGVWGNTVSVAMANDIGKLMYDCGIRVMKPSVLVGNSLCWLLMGGSILEFDLEKQSLAMIEKPADVHVNREWSFQILRTEDSGLGLAVLVQLNIQLWERKSNCNGVVRWLLRKTIELDMLLPLRPRDKKGICMVGYVEENNAILLFRDNCVVMVQLDSMQFKNLLQTEIIQTYYPYTSFYAAGRVLGGADEEPEILNNA